jgi:hypothetical protein
LDITQFLQKKYIAGGRKVTPAVFYNYKWTICLVLLHTEQAEAFGTWDMLGRYYGAQPTE